MAAATKQQARRVEPLTEQQAQAAALVAEGIALDDVAATIGEHTATVSEWREDNPAFIAEVNRRRREAWATAQDRLRALVPQALDALAEAVEAGGDDNPKGDLQERLQQEWKESPRYELIEESGPPHARHFTVAVFRGNSRLGEGQGASKREAEIQAARCALARLDLPEP